MTTIHKLPPQWSYIDIMIWTIFVVVVVSFVFCVVIKFVSEEEAEHQHLLVRIRRSPLEVFICFVRVLDVLELILSITLYLCTNLLTSHLLRKTLKKHKNCLK